MEFLGKIENFVRAFVAGRELGERFARELKAAHLGQAEGPRAPEQREPLEIYREIFRDPTEEAIDAVERAALFLVEVVQELREAALAAVESGYDLTVQAIPGGVAVHLDGRSLPFVLARDGGVRLGGELLPEAMSARMAVLVALNTLVTPAAPRGGGGGQVFPIDRGPKAPSGDRPAVPRQNAPTSALPN